MIRPLPPLALYVHLPWCVRKCPYCDFNSHTAGPHVDRDRYVDALVRDLRVEAERTGRRRIESIFLGGGTPSLFDAQHIERLLSAVQGTFALAEDVEITMEANPGTVERGRLPDYRAAGVSRLSLGAQSFDDAALSRLGRIHGRTEIFRAWREAERARFQAVNLDLMYALPGQGAAAAAADLRQAIALSPQHVSWYQLTLEPNTRFHACPPPDLPDEDTTLVIEDEGNELLTGAGYERYEVSAFALPGFRCRHNLNYWRFGDYIGIGAGAHGKLTDFAGGIERRVKPAHPRLYLEQVASGALPPAQRVTEADIAFEYMLNVLRLTEGFTEADFEARTGLSFPAVAAPVAEAVRLGLLRRLAAGSGWRPSRRGRRFLNDLQALFLPRREGSRGAATPAVA